MHGLHHRLCDRSGSLRLSHYVLRDFTFVHLARCAAAIFLRADADIVRFARSGADTGVFAIATGCEFRALAHLAFCARAILRRETADMILVGSFAVRTVVEPFSDTSIEIA
jgi:hypothetical protein